MAIYKPEFLSKCVDVDSTLQTDVQPHDQVFHEYR